METSSKLVTVDFLELDDMRLTLQKISIERKWRKKFPGWFKGVKTAYESSGFYIGRGVTQFTFYNIRADYFEINHIVKVFREKYKEYIISVSGHDIVVFLRKESK